MGTVSVCNTLLSHTYSYVMLAHQHVRTWLVMILYPPHACIHRYEEGDEVDEEGMEEGDEGDEEGEGRKRRSLQGGRRSDGGEGPLSPGRGFRGRGRGGRGARGSGRRGGARAVMLPPLPSSTMPQPARRGGRGGRGNRPRGGNGGGGPPMVGRMGRPGMDEAAEALMGLTDGGGYPPEMAPPPEVRASGVAGQAGWLGWMPV